MNNTPFINGIRFVLLVLLQVLICNHINFLGYINPYIYIIFILLFPVSSDTRMLFIFLSFLLGITIDIFSDSGGIHAAACVTIAYARPLIFRLAFGNLIEYQGLKLNKLSFAQRFFYFSIMIIIHHFVLFSLASFNFAQAILVLKQTLFSSIFTLILVLVLIPLFSRKRS
ncbi:rod shape-determining protein MreD [Zhouia sp. PK063]|uniref:rod shape-determining protein MreD n=1 Tax=Zhouia sp. PK063 TaxID=3373602 RepID=UPI003787ACD4